MDLVIGRQFSEIFRCNGCDTLLEAKFIERRSSVTNLSIPPIQIDPEKKWSRIIYTCPIEGEEQVVTLYLSKNDMLLGGLEFIATVDVKNDDQN